jgi:beta-lactamase regulating signal transducer with metallopeptidase domain
MENIINALAWTILHSLWQGAFLYLLLITLFATKIVERPSVKYLWMVLSACLFICVSGVTFFIYYNGNSTTEIVIEQRIMQYMFVLSSQSTPISMWSKLNSWVNQNTSEIVTVWTIGVTLFLLKTVLGLIYLHYQEQRGRVIDMNDYNIDIKSYLKRMNIKKQVKFKSLDIAISPYTTGIFKPVIFFPMVVLSQLTQDEIEAILIHEIAHIQRHDYFVNLMMVLVESLFFYHPFIWWLNHHLQISREESCDDVVKAKGINPVTYANALYKIEAILSSHNPTVTSFEMTAIDSKNKNQIINRIKRIFNMPNNQNTLKEKLAASVFILLFAIGINQVHARKSIDKPSVLNAPTPLKESIIEIDTTKPKAIKKTSHTIYKSEGDKSIELKMEDGEVTSLKIDDEEINKEDYNKYESLIEETKPLSIDRKRSTTIESRPRIIMDGIEIDLSDMDKRVKILTKDFEKSFGEGGRKLKIYTDGDSDNWQDVIEKIRDKKFTLRDSLRNLSFEELRGTLNKNMGSLKINLDSMVVKLDNLDSLFGMGKLHDHVQMKLYSPKSGDLIDGRFENLNLITPNLYEFRTRGNWKSGIQSALSEQLNADGFDIKSKDIEIEITHKNLKINGEKQPANMHTKYKRLIERETGLEIEEGTKLEYKVSDKNLRKKMRG